MGCGSNKLGKGPRIKSPISKVGPHSELVVSPANFVIANSKTFQEVYRMGKVIGSGAFGEVRRAIHRDTNEARAVKIFRKEMATESSKNKLMQEINILRSLDHPNIIRVYEFFEETKKFYIVMEQCNGGELFEEILKQQNFSENTAAAILHQIFSAVAYLHQKNIVHRDLKPENILLEERGDIMNIKLIDFGTAIQVEPNKPIKESIGTAYYIAPEVLSGNYNYKCDLWSCGVIIFILLGGYPPFDGQNDDEILSKVKKGVFTFNSNEWNGVSKEAKDLISLLLSPADTRITAEAALSHPWIKKKIKRKSISKEIISQTVNNLRTFNKNSKLREAVNTFISTQCLSLADTKELRDVFKAMDTNSDGKLSRQELYDYFVKEMDPAEAEEEVGRIMREVDTDNNGYVDYTEFIKATIDSKTIVNKGYLARAFKMFDKDGNGSISAAELKKILAGGMVYEDSIWVNIIKEFDLNGDGEIDLTEFENIILSKI
jgi:calcium-dependent protein kinase